jgi:hypothetical protein
VPFTSPLFACLPVKTESFTVSPLLLLARYIALFAQFRIEAAALEPFVVSEGIKFGQVCDG